MSPPPKYFPQTEVLSRLINKESTALEALRGPVKMSPQAAVRNLINLHQALAISRLADQVLRHNNLIVNLGKESRVPKKPKPGDSPVN